jgi:hypothetical protein
MQNNPQAKGLKESLGIKIPTVRVKNSPDPHSWHMGSPIHSTNTGQHNRIMGKNYGVGYYIYIAILGMVFNKSSNTVRSCRKLLPADNDNLQVFPMKKSASPTFLTWCVLRGVLRTLSKKILQEW